MESTLKNKGEVHNSRLRAISIREADCEVSRQMQVFPLPPHLKERMDLLRRKAEARKRRKEN